MSSIDNTKSYEPLLEVVQYLLCCLEGWRRIVDNILTYKNRKKSTGSEA